MQAPQLVEVKLTADQAILLHGAAAFAAEQAEAVGATLEEQMELQRLAAFFAVVGQEPRKFPPRSMASSVKSQLRALKGEAQPQSRRNKRKARQEKRTSFRKRERAQRRANAEAYNQARAEIEAMMAEADQPESQVILPPGVE